MKAKIAMLVAGAAMMLAAVPSGAEAACASKVGRGWGPSVDSAKFQAWEAVLQDTDWGMWAAWMASGAKVGSAASGYKVSGMQAKCRKDGSGSVCDIRAKLCN